MRAVVCKELGPPSGLVVDEVDAPTAGPGQVVVDVEAAGVNYVDALFVQGRYQIKPALPFVPGSEIAGIVSAVSDGVAQVAVGDRVLASCGLGGFAEQVAVSATSVSRIPEGLDAARAATFTQSYSTALFALRDRAHVEQGEVVLVLGAGGGVGLATIDVALALGAIPIGAASTDGKRQAATAAGARATIDTSTSTAAEDLKTRARVLAEELTAPTRPADRRSTGVDLVIDPVGGELAEPALRALGDSGRYVVIGFAAGPIPSLPLNQVLLRNRTVVGVDWGAWAMRHGPEQAELLATLLRFVSEASIHPAAPRTYPLAAVGEALDDLLGRRVVGKVALTT